MDHNIQSSSSPYYPNEDENYSTKIKSISATITSPEETTSSGFDCNICLDIVQDPVVTFCGHLYCWPCIYKWIHFQSLSAEKPEQPPPRCPVCKVDISPSTLVPLYGPSGTTKLTEGKPQQIGSAIPQRPSGPRYLSQQPASLRPSQQSGYPSHPPHLHRPQHSMDGYAFRTTPHGPTPVIGLGMFGAMVQTRMFNNSYMTLHAYPNPNHLAGTDNWRTRRRTVDAEISLGRVYFFLCCCVVFCLCLF